MGMTNLVRLDPVLQQITEAHLIKGVCSSFVGGKLHITTDIHLRQDELQERNPPTSCTFLWSHTLSHLKVYHRLPPPPAHTEVIIFSRHSSSVIRAVRSALNEHL